MTIRLSCLVLAWLLASAFHVEAQQTKLRASLQTPASDALLGQSLVRFKQEVEKRSNNAISMEIFDSGKLYIDDHVVQGVRSGGVEMGIAGFNQFSKSIPAIDVMEQPFLFNFEALVRAAMSPDNEIRRLIDKAILDALGVRILWWQSAGNQVFVSKGRNTTEPRQIKGQKIRVFSDTLGQFVRHCGGSPVMVSAARLQEAFLKSEIDMATGASNAIFVRELWKVADTITRTMHAPIEFSLIINDKVWQSLPESHRAILTEAARREERQSRETVTKIEAGLYTQFRQKGMTVHDLTADQVADWRACSAAVLENYLHGNADLARRLMAAYGKLRTDPCCTSRPDAGGNFNRR